jgi:DNA replication protein DnaC
MDRRVNLRPRRAAGGEASLLTTGKPGTGKSSLATKVGPVRS